MRNTKLKISRFFIALGLFLFRDEDDKATVLFHSVIYNSVERMLLSYGLKKNQNKDYALFSTVRSLGCVVCTRTS